MHMRSLYANAHLLHTHCHEARTALTLSIGVSPSLSVAPSSAPMLTSFLTHCKANFYMYMLAYMHVCVYMSSCMHRFVRVF